MAIQMVNWLEVVRRIADEFKVAYSDLTLIIRGVQMHPYHDMPCSAAEGDAHYRSITFATELLGPAGRDRLIQVARGALHDGFRF